MRIGFDLDNTIINYENLFAKSARQLYSDEICALSASKEDVKDVVKARKGNDGWVRVQAHVYGKLIKEASIYPGFEDFVNELIAQNHQLIICSHKTEGPVKNIDFDADFRSAARNFLEKSSLSSYVKCGLIDVVFCDSLASKISEIKRLECDYFIDDLRVVVDELSKSAHLVPIHFSPNDITDSTDLSPSLNWFEIRQRVLGEEKIREFLKTTPLVSSRVVLRPIETSGLNSRVWTVESGDEVYVVKLYNCDEYTIHRVFKDSEVSKLLYKYDIQKDGLCVACDELIGAGCFRFIHGVEVKVANEEFLHAAGKFLIDTNKKIPHDELVKIGESKEACLSAINLVGQINQRLDAIDSLDRFRTSDAMSVVKKRLGDLELNSPEFLSEPVIFSPSDFGTHNALRSKKDSYVWLDFEYAGFDSLLKCVCDFCLHPRNELDVESAKIWLAIVAKGFEIDQHYLEQKVREWIPFFAIRWVAIILAGAIREGSQIKVAAHLIDRLDTAQKILKNGDVLADGFR